MDLFSYVFYQHPSSLIPSGKNIQTFGHVPNIVVTVNQQPRTIEITSP